MKTLHSFAMLGTTHPVRQHITQDLNPESRWYGNLKSRTQGALFNLLCKKQLYEQTNKFMNIDICVCITVNHDECMSLTEFVTTD